MSDETISCVICHEEMEPHHQVVKPEDCEHTFHCICINVWLARHRSCPICHTEISLTTKMPCRTLFLTALTISHEMAVERATYTYVFLSLMLRRFSSSEEWLKARDTIIVASEQFELGTTRLPYLNLTNRTTAEQEKKKWYKLFVELTGETIQNSSRIQTARRWLLERLAFMFQD